MGSVGATGRGQTLTFQQPDVYSANTSNLVWSTNTGSNTTYTSALSAVT